MEDKERDELEHLVLKIQNMKTEEPLRRVMELSNPLTYSILQNYFFTSFERDDLLQEANGVLLLAIEAFSIEEGMPFNQFYPMLLVNHLNMLVRREHAQKRKVNIKTSSLDQLVEETGLQIQMNSSKASYPEEQLIAKETLHDYVLDLSAFEMQVFLLYLQGLTQIEIADKINASRAQVQNALYRCVMKLRSAIFK